MKTIYIIPGYGFDCNAQEYKKIAEIFKIRGFNVVPVKIFWKYHTMSDYVKQFKKQFDSEKEHGEIYLLGFSFGAMVAVISAAKFAKPKALFLCSVSPYFSEDLEKIKPYWKKEIGMKRVADLEGFSFNELAPKIACRTYIFAGTKEGKEVEYRVNQAKEKIANSELFWIKDAEHSLESKGYIEKIREVAEKI